VTGNIVFIQYIDWSSEPTVYKISQGDLIYETKLKIWEIFDFTRTIVHPNGKIYNLNDYFYRPTDEGDQIYIIPHAGLSTETNLVICVSIDYNSIRTLSDEKRKEVKLVLSSGEGNVEFNNQHGQEVNVKDVYVTPEYFRRENMKGKVAQQTGPECHVQ
jgi:hypothetical protein